MHIRHFALVGLLSLAAPVLLPSLASAHAFLDHAVPSVGGTVAAGPSELVLTFTEGVEAALSGVRISTAAGAAVAAAKPTADASNPATLHVHLTKPLMPGGYLVHWHVVSVDTHRTSGAYKFTVAP